MENQKKQEERTVQISESALLSLVADKLKDKVLFPDKIEQAKEYLSQLKTKDLNFGS